MIQCEQALWLLRPLRDLAALVACYLHFLTRPLALELVLRLVQIQKKMQVGLFAVSMDLILCPFVSSI